MITRPSLIFQKKLYHTILVEKTSSFSSSSKSSIECTPITKSNLHRQYHNLYSYVGQKLRQFLSLRNFVTSTTTDIDDAKKYNHHHNLKSPRRVWKAIGNDEYTNIGSNERKFWNRHADDTDLSSMRDVLDRIGFQERQGGRMRQSKLGVIR